MSKPDLDGAVKGIKRPYIPREAAIRVEQYATKKAISNKEAYSEIINIALNEKGDLKC